MITPMSGRKPSQGGGLKPYPFQIGNDNPDRWTEYFSEPLYCKGTNKVSTNKVSTNKVSTNKVSTNKVSTTYLRSKMSKSIEVVKCHPIKQIRTKSVLH